MQWEKLGLAYRASEHAAPGWNVSSALTPTPWRLDDDTIRVFCGFRDADGISRIGFVDVSAADPLQVRAVSPQPALDIGRDGCFDDNGVILGDVVEADGVLYLFHVGFQLVKKAKFLAFSGLSVSYDRGQRFVRVSEAPILDRMPGQNTIGAIHAVLRENGRWRIWFARGDDWEMISGRPFPRYHICHVETEDLLQIPAAAVQTCVLPEWPEYRIGRPRVYRLADGSYRMYATYGTTGGDYLPRAFVSADGVDWQVSPDGPGIGLSASGWDARTLCYPALIDNGRETLMFYNGNDMGLEGFGVARCRERLLSV